MKVILRLTNNSDIDIIYDLHTKCFIKSEHWYRSIIMNYLSTGLLLETTIKDKTKAIGLLLHGDIVPCSEAIFGNQGDDFIPTNDYGKHFLSNDLHKKSMHGIVMLCTHPKFRNKGLAKKLINKFHGDHPNKMLCLNTRASNPAYHLYNKVGYNHIGTIKNKYFLPTEDSLFMVKNNI
jgi:ribosomal protein S18 acetylase RimI-like enzyme